MADELPSSQPHDAVGISSVASLAAAVAVDAAKADPAMAARAARVLEKQAELLDEQMRLIRLQVKDLEDEDAIRHWSSRLHHISNVMKVAFEVAVAFFLVAVAAIIIGAVWTASHDNGLIIESFSVPPDLTNRGLTGEAVAAQLQDKLAAMQYETNSSRPANSYANNWGNDIKVQIPDTGVSVGEFYRTLAAWLGHQTQITGEVYHTPKGIEITARVGSDAGAKFAGAEENLDSLVQQSAEAIFARTQPYRYAIYLASWQRQGAAATRILQKLSVEGETPRERAWAFVGLGASAAHTGSDYAALADNRRAIAMIPDFALAWQNVNEYENTLGHDEAALAAAHEVEQLLESDGNVDMTARAKTIILPAIETELALQLGDFATALRKGSETETLPDYSGNEEHARQNVVVALAGLHEQSRVREALHELPPVGDPILRATRTLLRLQVTFASGDWRAVESTEPDVERAFAAAGLNTGPDGNTFAEMRKRLVWPDSAYAYAATGDFARADALISKTPLDCYLCVTTRGVIRAMENDWGAAKFWFSEGVREAPSIPFVYVGWGRLLLRKGDVGAAIDKFENANARGPHFADPIELWGEALIRSNRSDLAAAKFEDANKSAPNWGRLHLKWGEALLWSGKPDAAKRQFAVASNLFLTSSEKSELARVSHG